MTSEGYKLVKKTFVTLLVSLLLVEASITAGVSAASSISEEAYSIKQPSAPAQTSSLEQSKDTYRQPRIISYQPSHQGTLSIRSNPTLQFTFDEEVKKGDGFLILFEASTNKEVWRSSVSDQSILISNNQRTVTWQPSISLQGNMNYYVVVENGTFKGEHGDFAGLYGQNGWSFKTVQDTIAPIATSFIPAPGRSDFFVGSNLSITFSEPVWANKGNIHFKSLTRGNLVGMVPVNSPQVTGNGTNTITIDPIQDFKSNDQIVVTVDEGAFVDQDKNLFRGIKEEEGWQFWTKGNDSIMPVLQSYRLVAYDTIRLIYNESLNRDTVPPLKAYRILVNGKEQVIDKISIQDSYVDIKLKSGINTGLTVLLSYTVPKQSPYAIEDLAGNRASDIGGIVIENGKDTAAPKVENAVISGSTLKLTFDETLGTVSTNALSQFRVTYDDRNVTLRRLEHSGRTVTLTLQHSVSNGQIVKVSYTPNNYPIKDETGNALRSFQGQLVQNLQDTKAPTLEQTSVKGSLLTLTYNELLDPNSIPMRSHYSVLVNDAARYVERVQVINNTVVLTLSSGVKESDEVRVSYVPGDAKIRDLAGNAAVGFSYRTVTDSSDTTAPTLRTGVIKGSVVTLVFSEKLNASSAPSLNQFYVYASNVNRKVKSASIQNDTVTLVLESPVSAAANVSLTYVPGNVPLKDLSGNQVASFGNAVLSNQTDQVSGRPDDVVQAPYEAFLDSNLFLLQSKAASTTSERSRYGVSIKRYTVNESKLREALQYAVRYSSDHHLAFEVPASEKAAMVAVPLQVLEEIYASEKDAKFSIRYGDVIYTLPLKNINYSQLKRQFSQSSSIYVQLQIEGALSYATQMAKAVEDSGAEFRALPIDLYASAYSSSTPTQALVVQTEAKVKVNRAVYNDRTSMIRYDRAGDRLQYIPNTIKQGGGLSVLRFYPSDNDIFAAVERSKSFSDIRAHWAQASISHLANKFIIEGVSSSRFAPNASVTRGQFTVLLARSFGLESNASAANAYSDVGSSHPMVAYIGAATKAGIIGGYENGTFRPNQNISREQMAVMLVRTLDYVKQDTAYNSNVLQGFKDRGRISSYAKDAVIRSVSSGLIAGVTTNTFDPQGIATRAQAAVMLERLLVQVNYLTK
ncbi:SwmB domain-containing protein [Paenibacillus sp. 1001270B_150601_E10]|uniref:SwmB domain-containing protein n=1 Tax=Paenibacillus sp. 1001270B_150601_E10 TaxID=2787079 RepID=UPI001E49961D|nr:SwmB domain-containing protein [Paenibacillus sp. 1001270B_150601_E10]